MSELSEFSGKFIQTLENLKVCIYIYIHVNTTKLRNIMCTLVSTSVILWSLECVSLTKVRGTIRNPCFL